MKKAGLWNVSGPSVCQASGQLYWGKPTKSARRGQSPEYTGFRRPPRAATKPNEIPIKGWGQKRTGPELKCPWNAPACHADPLFGGTAKTMPKASMLGLFPLPAMLQWSRYGHPLGKTNRGGFTSPIPARLERVPRPSHSGPVARRKRSLTKFGEANVSL